MVYDIDITNILDKNNNIFNPSICHWKGDYYICSYRIFVRYEDVKKQYLDPYSEPNHPWLGGDKSTLWWQRKKGYDKTVIVLLKIKNGKVSKKRNIREYIDGVDARVFKIRDNDFIIYYNVYIREKNHRLDKLNKCEDGCMIVAMDILSIADNKIKLHSDYALCPEISQKIEKNWSLWSNDSKLYMSYGITMPHHIVYPLVVDKNNNFNCGKIIRENQENILVRLEKYYKHIAYISTSTPALQNSYGEYIGVGHLKYKYNDIYKLDSNTPLYKFHKTIRGKILHPLYVYVMFFYSFKFLDKNISINRISKFYLNGGDTDYALIFPSGLTKNNDKWIVSYGDGDSKCKLLIYSEDEINSLLIYNNDNNSSDIMFDYIGENIISNYENTDIKKLYTS